MLADQPLPGDEGVATTQTAAAPTPSIPATPPGAGVTVEPGTVELEVVNASGADGVATSAATALNGIGFAITEDQLRQEDATRPGVTVEYDPTNVDAAVTVAAAVPGSTMVPVTGLGTTVRLVLGETFDGAVQAVQAGVAVTGTVDPAASGMPANGAPATSELQSVNAGEDLCV